MIKLKSGDFETDELNHEQKASKLTIEEIVAQGSSYF